MHSDSPSILLNLLSQQHLDSLFYLSTLKVTPFVRMKLAFYLFQEIEGRAADSNEREDNQDNLPHFTPCIDIIFNFMCVYVSQPCSFKHPRVQGTSSFK
jgi:hypothetical protein